MYTFVDNSILSTEVFISFLGKEWHSCPTFFLPVNLVHLFVDIPLTKIRFLCANSNRTPAKAFRFTFFYKRLCNICKVLYLQYIYYWRPVTEISGSVKYSHRIRILINATKVVLTFWSSCLLEQLYRILFLRNLNRFIALNCTFSCVGRKLHFFCYAQSLGERKGKL